MRLDHFLALANVGTKDKVRGIIYDGEITLNGQICAIPSTAIKPNIDCIEYKGETLSMRPVYYALHKPQGCLTAREPNAITVFDCLSDVDTDGLFAVGRLDKDTEGLIFLTNDGNFSNALMAPENHINKTYQFLSLNELTPEKIRQLETGMDIGDDIVTKPACVRIIKSGLYKDLSQEIGAMKMKKIKKQPDMQTAFIGEIIISEGKKHQVKRMLRGVHCPIIYLKRIAIGDYALPNIPSGEYLSLSKHDLLKYFS